MSIVSDNFSSHFHHTAYYQKTNPQEWVSVEIILMPISIVLHLVALEFSLEKTAKMNKTMSIQVRRREKGVEAGRPQSEHLVGT